ncbi:MULTISPECIES: hypothetical protein [unclassified Mesorhizobium]|uniref:hypothetical protein n=1 Tax=unclassified Mesorhizobium TaxID=325217 RepID=UPI0003CF523E|nr:hypothetical protein [Mesorhizobium sp. LSJC280B00]ESW80766.1 hypothetical protein X772_24495 [Mesorhizobium sp. LSJC280B00]
MLIAGSFYLALGMLLGFWINSKQLALVAVALCALVIGAGQGTVRSTLLAAAALSLLQLGYFIALLVRSILVHRREQTKPLCWRHNGGADG